ncbi:MAG: L-threonylcarbamoyladenylate synthase [Bacteroidales bacterium]|jgi:L-threonylcarbamoyladenylate synthase|nr:L-threonylcarbamoyladenylate synthase [Bacteroidales bacterium]
MDRKEIIRQEVQKCIEILENGGVILYPTDTIWGIGCDATNPDAVKKVYELKQRVETKSMLVLINRPERIPSYVNDMPDVAWDLIEYTEKPLTIIYSGAKNLANNLVSDDGTIGIRVSSFDFNRILIERFKKPIVSTSANISGNPSPGCFDDIDDDVKNKVDYVVNLDQDIQNSQPSSIIKLGTSGEVNIIRE